MRSLISIIFWLVISIYVSGQSINGSWLKVRLITGKEDKELKAHWMFTADSVNIVSIYDSGESKDTIVINGEYVLKLNRLEIYTRSDPSDKDPYIDTYQVIRLTGDKMILRPGGRRGKRVKFKRKASR